MSQWAVDCSMCAQLRQERRGRRECSDELSAREAPATTPSAGLCHTFYRTLNMSLHYPVKYKSSTIAILLMYLRSIIDLLLNISICVLLNHIKCSKCPSLTWTHAQIRLCHRYIPSAMTLCPTPCQTFVSRCFSSSTSWTWWVSQMFPCMHPCQRKAILAFNVTREYT